MFASSVSVPEKPDVLAETLDALSESRTADEINGANGTRFYIQRPKADKLNEINASDFGLSEKTKIILRRFRMHSIIAHSIRRQNLLLTRVHIISEAQTVLTPTIAQIC